MGGLTSNVGQPGPVCMVCNRLHDSSEACPKRIANAYTMQPQALEKLTEVDLRWMKNHPDLSVLDILENAIAIMM